MEIMKEDCSSSHPEMLMADLEEYDTEEEARPLQPPKKKKTAIAGEATYKTKFKKVWKKEFPCTCSLSVFSDPYCFWCNVCRTNTLCNHQGKGGMKAHCRTAGHQKKAMELDKQPQLPNFLVDPTKANLDKKTIGAEVKMAILCAHANIHVPTAFHDKSPAIRRQFTLPLLRPMCMLNGAVAPSLIPDLLAKMKTSAFSLMIDGSNNSGLQKMNPITVRIFNTNLIKTHFLDMCPTTSSTADRDTHIIREFLSE